MILDEKQYEAAIKKLDKLNRSIARIDENDERKYDRIKKFELAGLKGFATQIQKEVDDFDLLRSGVFEPPKTFNLTELPKILIQARIAGGWSQRQLADSVGTSLSRLQLYEEELYLGASFSKQMQIADALLVNTADCVVTNSSDKLVSASKLIGQNAKDLDWTKFPVEEVFKKGWITKTSEHNKNDTFKHWFLNTIGPYGTPTFHRRKVSDDQDTDKEAILTWEARILQLAQSELENSSIPDFALDERWLKDLVRLTNHEDGPILAKEALKNQGILLIIEKNLSKTFIDGAAMLSHEGVPIIAMTIRLDRLDNFWFTLFHELGHVYCHLYSNSNFNFFDQISSSRKDETCQPSQFWGDELEVQANKFALEKLIDSDSWDTCLSRFSATERSVLDDANRLEIHPSIIAGRIRDERGNYSILNCLTGQGMVRKFFFEDSRL